MTGRPQVPVPGYQRVLSAFVAASSLGVAAWALLVERLHERPGEIWVPALLGCSSAFALGLYGAIRQTMAAEPDPPTVERDRELFVQGRKSWGKVWERYLAGAATVFAIGWLLADGRRLPELHFWVFVVGGGLFVLVLMWELTLVLAAGAVVYLFASKLIGALAAIPTSVAIIIGAYIIAVHGKRD